MHRPGVGCWLTRAKDLLLLLLHAIRPNQMPRFRVFTRVILQAESRRLSGLSCVTHTCQVVLATVSASVVDIEERAGEPSGVRRHTRRGRCRAAHRPPLAESDPSRQRYRVLLEINNAIISNLARDSLFHAITKALHQVIPFDRAMLPLYDAEKDVFQTFALEGPALPGHVHDVQTEIRRHGTGAGWVLDHRQPLLRRNLEVERELAADEMLLAGGIRSYVIVPLIARDQTLGALFLGVRPRISTRRRMSGSSRRSVRQIALAIENMLAYEEIARLRARLEEENRYLQEEIKSEHNFEEITGRAPG